MYVCSSPDGDPLQLPKDISTLEDYLTDSKLKPRTLIEKWLSSITKNAPDTIRSIYTVVGELVEKKMLPLYSAFSHLLLEDYKHIRRFGMSNAAAALGKYYNNFYVVTQYVISIW